MGPVDKMGYRERDLAVRSRRNALLRRIKAGAQNKYMSSAWLGGPRSQIWLMEFRPYNDV